MSLLEVKELEVQYVTSEEVVRAVNGISFKLEKGECLGLVGETGAGKTTTALSIIRLLPDPPAKVSHGEILYNGKDLLKVDEKEMQKIRGNDITMIFQDPMTALNPVKRVGDQIAEVIKNHQDCSNEEAYRKACKMLEDVGIRAERATEYPHQFSGGMKQRVIIAIALACEPNLLLADEPTTALDVTIQAQVIEMMIELRRKYQMSMIFITHDLGVVADICDKVAIMYAGEIIEYGSLKDIFLERSHPYTKGLFGSIPSLTKDVDRLEPIKGMMPNPANLPAGCKFHPRCPYAMEICSKIIPGETVLGDGHFVRCHLYSREDKKNERD
ncbi:MAG: ABC transporter ATP-binding protein [Peptococcaceae bacterium]|jgi:peptide/nickel transport system ATP-binding protein|nr:ABC transporter ATP-binding protein [Peptococcaceae bacterium]MDH7524459.1 ABC transporter ATP-binding protein [Peptococcaceae bacterium]